VTSKGARRRSIRGKLTLLVLASVGAAVALVTCVLAWRESSRETHAAYDRLSSIAQLTAAMSEEATAQGDRARAYAALRVIAVVPDVSYARIERADGTLLAETGAGVRLTRDVVGAAGGGASTAALVGSHTAEVTAPILYGGRTVGRVVMLGKLGDGGALLFSSLLLSLGAGLAAALAGLAVARRMQRRIAGPVVALTEAMQAVRESHDYGKSAEVEADDEVGDLVAGFNDMLVEIRKRDKAIAEHMAGLEGTVAERTADLKVAKEAAEAASVAKSDFLATMSHEIRTPMNGVMVMAEMLAAGELPPKQRRFAEVIAKSGASLLAIINDILDFSKIEAGKLELEAAPTDPAEVIEDVLALFWERARSKGLDLAAHIDPAMPALIEADPTRLRQVIGNLVNNAIKFTETGAVMVQAAPQETKAGPMLRIAVRDTGIGIPKDKIPGLFEAFTQADQSTTRRFGGTGLGLAICRRLAEAMGGRLSADSTVGKGSVFALDLPMKALASAPEWPQLHGETAWIGVRGAATRAAVQRYLKASGVKSGPLAEDEMPGLLIAEPAALKGKSRNRAPVICLSEYGETQGQALLAAGQADLVLVQPLRRRELAAALAQIAAGAPLSETELDAGPAGAAALPHFSGRRILVADDSAVNREVALEALSQLGCAVTLVDDGKAAVEAAGAGPFDLILMDASMPQMDGYEASAEIRRQAEEASRTKTPIVALTAHVVGAAADRWREAGMDGMLSKPFTLAALAAKLAEFVTPVAAPTAVVPASPPPAAPAKLPAPKPDRKPPATATATAAADLLDPQVTTELARLAAAGKTDFVDRIRRLYRENAPQAVKALIAACTAGDASAAAKAAHALKSMSLNMGARVVAESCARIEAQARDLSVVNVDQAQIVHRQLLATLDVLEGYPPELRVVEAAAPDEEALLADLRKAIDNDELTLVYQPQFDCVGETITGIETLVRWTHPERGFVSPAFFIPIAERYGVIGRVTHWVLSRAMRETRDLGDFTIGFNASAVEFADPSFVDELSVLIARAGFDPKRLEIEVTETAVLAEEDEVRRNMTRLHDLGLKIALDDFGVGYSSLSHLRLFPFDKLKIDRAFVTGCAENIQSATLVHAVVSIGRALGMQVVAEGVETEAQRKFLKVAGVHAMQGYLFAKPEPVEALKARLAAMRTPQAMSA
jgi:EAL domain-containing protein (putative c-di-GMP-specific phosphodiesterase class I)/signal transduction histidine kinase/CheY-like chemotaxis protein